jgi:hypothetical protein
MKNLINLVVVSGVLAISSFAYASGSGVSPTGGTVPELSLGGLAAGLTVAAGSLIVLTSRRRRRAN